MSPEDLRSAAENAGFRERHQRKDSQIWLKDFGSTLSYKRCLQVGIGRKICNIRHSLYEDI